MSSGCPAVKRTQSVLELITETSSDEHKTISNVNTPRDSPGNYRSPPSPPLTVKTDSNLVNGNNLSNSVEQLRSCLSRRASSVASITKKRVIYNDSTVVIGDSSQETITLKLINDLADWHTTIDDDEVFSDSIEPQLPRGDMCTPYPKRRSSIPGMMFLPDWFGDDRFAPKSINAIS